MLEFEILEKFSFRKKFIKKILQKTLELVKNVEKIMEKYWSYQTLQKRFN